MCNKLLVALILLGAVSVARAQVSGNAFLGYSFANVGSSAVGIENGNRIALNGWNASVEVKIIRWVGVVADFSGGYGSGKQSFTQPTVFFTYDARQHDYLFGPRFSATLGKIRPFAEGLLGVGQTSTTTDDLSASDTSFAMAFGGGVDYAATKILGLRVQGDYVRTSFFSSSQNDFRLSTGVVVRF
jgi:opacity protein-like surface antigen